jgi:hypothetical protein
MKTSLTLATMLLLLIACDSTGPDRVVTPAEDELTLESLASYAEKIAPEQTTQLLVVGQAAFVYNAARRDPGAFLTNERGFQRATWTDQDDVRRSWLHDCWTGTPTFPGSDSYDPCGGISGPFTDLTPEEVLRTTLAMVRAIASVDGYQLLWSTVQRDGDYQSYELCYQTPEGGVYYWRWTTGIPLEQS